MTRPIDRKIFRVNSVSSRPRRGQPTLRTSRRLTELTDSAIGDTPDPSRSTTQRFAGDPRAAAVTNIAIIRGGKSSATRNTHQRKRIDRPKRQHRSRAGNPPRDQNQASAPVIGLSTGPSVQTNPQGNQPVGPTTPIGGTTGTKPAKAGRQP